MMGMPDASEMNRQLRVLYATIGLVIRGNERLVLDLVADQARRGSRVMVCTLEGGGPHEGTLRELGVPWVDLDRFAQGLVHKYWLGFVPVVRRFKPDIIHLNLAARAHAWLALLARLSRPKTKLVATFLGHEAAPRGLPGRATYWVHRNLIHRVVALTPGLAEYAAAQGRALRSQLVVVGCGVDTERFRPREQLDMVADCPLPEKAQPFVVGTVCRLVPNKGLHTLLEAWALHLRDVSLGREGQRLVVVGSGALIGDLRKQARQLAIEDTVLWLGQVRNVYEIVPTWDLFVTASPWEGFGIAVAEAMACGVPIVATDIIAFRDVLDRGRVARLVPPDNPVALASEIRWCMEHPRETADMAERARQRVCQRYSLQAICDAYHQVYLELLRR